MADNLDLDSESDWSDCDFDDDLVITSLYKKPRLWSAKFRLFREVYGEY